MPPCRMRRTFSIRCTMQGMLYSTKNRTITLKVAGSNSALSSSQPTFSLTEPHMTSRNSSKTKCKFTPYAEAVITTLASITHTKSHFALFHILEYESAVNEQCCRKYNCVGQKKIATASGTTILLGSDSICRIRDFTSRKTPVCGNYSNLKYSSLLPVKQGIAQHITTRSDRELSVGGAFPIYQGPSYVNL